MALGLGWVVEGFAAGWEGGNKAGWASWGWCGMWDIQCLPCVPAKPTQWSSAQHSSNSMSHESDRSDAHRAQRVVPTASPPVAFTVLKEQSAQKLSKSGGRALPGAGISQ